MHHAAAELVVEIITSFIERATVVGSTMQMYYEYPAETLTANFVCQIHEDIP